MTPVDHPILYQVDSKGKLRHWRMQTDGGRHRTLSGIVGGKVVTSGWVVVEPKNVGRSNATTVEQQAILETEADYKLKLDKKYYYSADEARAAGSGTKFLSPMLAEKWEEQKGKLLGKGRRFFLQPKLDGIRATISKDGMLSRAGKPIVACPHITRALEEFFHANPCVVALDGELYNHALKHDFNKITSLVKKVKPTAQELAESDLMIQFHCYDVILNGEEKFEDRILYRDNNLDQTYCIKHVHTVEAITEEQVDDFHAQQIVDGYEGSMIRLNEVYESKRSKSLMKRKDFFDTEYRIAEFMEGKGDWAGAVKAVKFYMPDGRVKADGELPEAGCRGTQADLRDLMARAMNGTAPKWATIRYPNLTPDGFPRFGQVTQWHDEEREL